MSIIKKLIKSKKKIIMICGTRPEIIKLASLYHKLIKNNLFDFKLCLTGQHPDLTPPLLKALNIPDNEKLVTNWNNLDNSQILNKLKQFLTPIILGFAPDLIIVQGDTSSSFCAAIVAAEMKIPLAHIEAGLRTYDFKAPFPEEINRQNISKLSKWHFCPTDGNKANLLKEGINPKTIFVTGNTVIDTLKAALKTSENTVASSSVPYILITLHRRESHGSPLRGMLHSLADLASRYPKINFIFPIHPNPIITAAATEIMSQQPNIILKNSIPYPEFIKLMKNAFFIISDSGGIQEEAPFLNVPLLVLREKTERMEAVKTGAIKLVGTAHDKILDEARLLIHNQKYYKDMKNAANPFGDGKASDRIIKTLTQIL